MKTASSPRAVLACLAGGCVVVLTLGVNGVAIAAGFGPIELTPLDPPTLAPHAWMTGDDDDDDDSGTDEEPTGVEPETMDSVEDAGAAEPVPTGDDDDDDATAPTDGGDEITVVTTGPPPEEKKNRFGAAARARLVAVPGFVLGIIGLKERAGTVNKGFAVDFVYRREVVRGKRALRGFDLGLSFFWEDYRFSKGVPCRDFETGGSRAGSAPINCSDYYPGNASNVTGSFWLEDGDADLETEYRLQNFRAIGIEILFGGWWTLNPFLAISVGGGVGPVKVLGKMVYSDTYETQAGQAPDARTPCAATGSIPVEATKAGTGCAEVGITEDDVPPWVGVLRLYVGLQFKIIPQLEIFVNGGIGGPSIFHADVGVRAMF